jgi:hypothetical protein
MKEPFRLGFRTLDKIGHRAQRKELGNGEMQKVWHDTILEEAPSTPEIHEVEDTNHFEPQEDDASSTVHQKRVETLKLNGVVIGILVSLNDAGEPLVDFPANPSGVSLMARSTVTLGNHEIGRELALMFENGDPDKPIVMGLIQHPEQRQFTFLKNTHGKKQSLIETDADGARLVFTAKNEIVLRCGKASITLTRTGKVLIRGTYLLSRSSGVNRIKGGSIQLN